MMYRSRMGKNLDDITLSYVSSISEDNDIFFYDIVGSQAHCIMLYENKIISKTDVTRILKALEKLKKEKIQKKSNFEDIHELIESYVIKIAGQASGGKMHTARSRNDQVSLDIRMKIRDDINIICQNLLDTIEVIVSLAQAHQKTVMPLYTHLQQAQVGVFSHYLLAYGDALFRDVDRLYVTYGRVNENPLGAGPIGGTSIPINRKSTEKMLGFHGLVENSIDATSTRDFVAEYVAAISILMTNLSRISEDFIIWSSSEFSFIELSDEFTSPSSVMPQKKNPDILELTRGKTAQVIGYLNSILSTIKGLPSGYNRDLQQIKSSIWSTSSISTSSLIVFKLMLMTITINKSKMKKSAEGGYLIALDLAEKLVQKEIPFRTAHKVIGQIVQIASISKKPLSKITSAEVKTSVKGTNVDSKLLLKLINSVTIESSLRDRNSQGSSGILEQKRMIMDRMNKLKMYREGTSKRENQIKNTYENLSKKVKLIIK